ncbi:putative immune-type receptor 15a precursor [Clarias magur]|uniref:Putative immune-type receptor 15a n=1 Tax=Clarias magur TaxID=1594786 RepID=A0A8J4T6E9_CLAMG|nr:putative immune-type receptor 15a precursor [Clarias magur]
MLVMWIMTMVMWIAAVLFYKVADSIQTDDISQPNPVITADVGDNVTLHCFRLHNDNSGVIVWYKQKAGQEPRVMVTVHKQPNYEHEFKSARFSIERGKLSCHVKIANVQPSDEATYYCGFRRFLTRFGNGTLLSVKGDGDVKVSVFQSGVLDSVPAGASVTLQCSVLSESRAAELQVLWFRAAPPQSHPQIIYTHHNSSHQCESGSPTHTCVYNFSKNILSHNDTGTYYCAVAVCGRIIFGNGTRVQLEKPVDAVVIGLTVAVGVCVVVIFALVFVITCEGRNRYSAQQNYVNQPNPLVTADIGGNVTLQCFRLQEVKSEPIVWYKQKIGNEPRIMVTVVHEPNYEEEFKSPRYSIEIEKGSCYLKIFNVEPSDEAIYYCGLVKFVKSFGKGTFLSVKGKPDLSVSVFQSGVSDSVPAGASVTLQCSVLSESRAAELQVLWFRAAPPQSHPQIIYTHHNSSHQCESGSPTHTCVYNFSKNILSLNDTGTYYCAVAACGKIIFGNGTRVQLEKSADPAVIYFTVALGVCVAVIAVQAVLLYKWRNHEQHMNPVESVDLTRLSFLSVTSGERVTLKCPFGDIPKAESVVWYKQKFGEMPQKVGERLVYKGDPVSPELNASGFKMETTDDSFFLTIPHVQKEHGGLYYCGKFRWENFALSNGTFLDVAGKPDLSVSVFQSGVSDSVPAGASVTLQCSVLSESRAAELQVLWIMMTLR